MLRTLLPSGSSPTPLAAWASTWPELSIDDHPEPTTQTISLREKPAMTKTLAALAAATALAALSACSTNAGMSTSQSWTRR